MKSATERLALKQETEFTQWAIFDWATSMVLLRIYIADLNPCQLAVEFKVLFT